MIMKNKILFISSMAFSSLSGGAQCSKRNLDSIIEIFGISNVIPYVLKPFSIQKITLIDICKTIFNTINLRINGISRTVEDDIYNKIIFDGIDIIFIDASLNGRLIKRIKKNLNVKVICFFHNCEYSLVLQQFLAGEILVMPRLYSCYFGEKLACRYADKIIGLNVRDHSMIYRYYNRKVDVIIPISLKDRFVYNDCLVIKSEKKRILFVGSNFYPNIHGIKWFIRNVLPYIDVQLTIVGKNIHAIGINSSEKIEIISDSPVLDKFYLNTDIVIAPIFKGSGMKVKIAEAMMFGKPIVGTTEAFQGYQQVNGMYEANTSQEFVKIITREFPPKYNLILRANFLTKYSFEATLSLFKKTLLL
ncbi:hypothetical protein EZS27_011974 [termite gut metagenome]|uniref:Glycosyltransferase n=1 Tax=termite gut metagenome TaxID=433724 RepID=A0A5J4S423_9ZZZZ